MYCNGATNSRIVTNRNCLVPLPQLIVSPFNLVLGNSIDVKVVAVN
jgi:hypothetical protein